MTTRVSRLALRATHVEWGPQCDVYEPRCACCVAWRLFAHNPTIVPHGDVVNAAIRAVTMDDYQPRRPE